MGSHRRAIKTIWNSRIRLLNEKSKKSRRFSSRLHHSLECKLHHPLVSLSHTSCFSLTSQFFVILTTSKQCNWMCTTCRRGNFEYVGFSWVYKVWSGSEAIAAADCLSLFVEAAVHRGAQCSRLAAFSTRTRLWSKWKSLLVLAWWGALERQHTTSTCLPSVTVAH